MADEWVMQIEKEREDWKHFLNEVVGPFALAAALSAVATKNPNLYAKLYMIVIIAMIFYRTKRYSSLYFSLVNKSVKTISEKYTSATLQVHFFPNSYLMGFWLYFAGFISLGVVALFPPVTFVPLKLVVEKYINVVFVATAFLLTGVEIYGYLNRFIEKRRML